MKKPLSPKNNLESIEESLERMSCSLAQIHGVLDALLQEVLEKKKATSPQGPPPSFEHDRR